MTAVLVSNQTEEAFYQREEIAAAIAMARRMETAHRVVPIYITGFPKEAETVPYGLRLKHGMALSDVVTLDEIAKRLSDLVRPLSIPSVRPPSELSHPESQIQKKAQELRMRLGEPSS
jgi:hypothetical protein